MDSLAKSVEQTLKNLQEKKRFLQQQRDRYINIRQRILQYDDDDAGQSKDGIMQVFDDVIMSPERMFVNVGYDYYVEKSQDELLAYADEKRKLIEQAIEQFDSKIKDGEKAIRSFGMLLQSEQAPIQFEDAGDESGGELPPMEIREELDEDGNIISSSVTPAVASLDQEKQFKDNDEATGMSDFERNIKGRLAEQKSQQEEEPQKHETASINGAFSTENMYTFADLVRQLDEQDELEEEIDSSEVQYDFESFDSKYLVEHLTEEGETQGEDQVENDSTEESADEDDDDENHYMIAPTMEAHSAFMDQLKKLREKKIEQKLTEQPEAPVKSILKPSSGGKKKPKKSVGFASKLDIHEVENLKQDNRRNRHNLSSSFMQQLEHDNDEEVDNEFDSDLFAQLIGARGPDEIHDKYKSDIVQETLEKDPNIDSSNKKKIKISRFKQEIKCRSNECETKSRISSSDSTSRYETNRSIDRNARAPMDLASKREEIFLPTDSSRIMERDMDHSAVVDLIIENEPDEFTTTDSRDEAEVNQPAIQELIVEKETDGVTNADLIVEKDIENLAADIHSTDVSEYNCAIRHGTLETFGDVLAHKDKASPFSKTMRSLHRSARPKRPSQNMTYEFPDSSEDLSGTSDSDEHLSEIKSESVAETFPAEVMNGGRSTSNTISLPKVDFNALGDNLDDMAKAYSLGIYDNDLDEDPGTLLEKIDDFKHYNEQVEALKSDIEAFKIANPMQEFDGNQQTTDEDGPLLTEIKENDFPESYNEVSSSDDLALEPARLNESIAIEYSRLREVISAASDIINGVKRDQDDESKQIEPIDQDGRPIRLSRFKSQRLQIGK
ncbi:hypothetical protein HG536_0B06530 [Torulaspora globosa]|uniref:DUF3835 domain-containing protein n=1 Tax=Torulaspora globosa TaxID=48254 RepID=A0A7G3ZE49_9SACH|nr:uncharacterized protein HG536_0B06530 [Torulaspora globosa]QLL31785.1 hypothetical protein HG536_0B06530 [Torulaspora globosa]